MWKDYEAEKEDEGWGMIFVFAVIFTLVVTFCFWRIKSTVRLDYNLSDTNTLIINDIEISYKGSLCEDGLFVFRRAHISTGSGIGVNLKHWVSPVLCEE
jgi:hypothetical protein